MLRLVGPVAIAALSVVVLIVAPQAVARDSAAPVLGRVVVVVRVSGRVSVEVRGTHGFANLTSSRSLPVGSTVDATQGVVELTTATPVEGATQHGVFDGGAFGVTQDDTGLATLRLVSGRRGAAVCGRGQTAHAAALSGAVLRLLHASAHGRFRTTGRYAAATVRGTQWTTIDSCAGTRIDDTTGDVATQANNGQLGYTLRPGEQVVYRCASHGQPHVSREYCVAVLLVAATSVVAGRRVRRFNFSSGVITRSTETTAQLCVTGPRRTNCTKFPLQPVGNGVRDAVALCVPAQGSGSYSLSWRVRGVALGSPLTFSAPVGASFEPCLTWVGQPLIGSQPAVLGANVKTVNPYSLPTVAHAWKIVIFLLPAGTAGQQMLRGVVYADSGGAPGALVATTDQLTFSSSDTPGWYDLTFPRHPSPQDPSGLLVLAPGRYWIGVIAGAGAGIAAVAYDVVPGFEDYNANTYNTGPSNPFGSITTGDEQLSMYMDYYAPPF